MICEETRCVLSKFHMVLPYTVDSVCVSYSSKISYWQILLPIVKIFMFLNLPTLVPVKAGGFSNIFPLNLCLILANDIRLVKLNSNSLKHN